MRNQRPRYSGGHSEKRPPRIGWSVAAMIIAVAVTGFLLWMGLSWAVGLVASAVRLTLMTVTLGGVAILLLWFVGRGLFRR